MRVLILSATTGGGHNATARALGEQMEACAISYEIADALAFISKRLSEFISWGHSYVYRRLPKLFGVGYRYGERHSTDFLLDRCAKGADALHHYLEAGEYDAVICTHVFSGLMMTALRLRYSKAPPCYFVATDYTCSPGVARLDADGFFIPHPALLGEFVSHGVAAEKLFATGIPVDASFYKEENADGIRRRLGLPTDQRLVLLGCGSMGCGNLERSAKMLLKSLPKEVCLVVLCGTNQRAYELLRQYEGRGLVPLPFVQNVWEYLCAADIYLTKPGGLTTTEAIARQTPMILVNAVPGCETHNYRFLTRCGVACGAKSWRHANRLLRRVLTEEGALRGQKEAMEGFCATPSAGEICRILLERHSS